MPSPGLTATWGQEQWSSTLIEALSLESAILRAGATRVVSDGRVVHVPRLLVNPDADWVAELTELPSDSGDADTLALVPRKIGNVVNLSNEPIEDASVNELDGVGQAMVRGVATKVDARAFSTSAATAIAPAGLLSGTMPGGGTSVDTDTILDGIGAIGGHGGVADTVFINPADLTALRKERAVPGGQYLLQPDAQAAGAERIGGATLIPTAGLAAGTAVVAEARFIVLAVRKDASVDFSSDAAFTSDATVARVTMRVDWAVSDPNALYVVG